MAEQEQVLRHYRYGGKITHIGVEALPNGKDITVVIDRISFIDNEVINGEKQAAWVCYFKQNPYFTLPMVLNATNKKRLAKLSGTPYLETVKDLPVTLTQEMDKAIGGGRDFALRVSNIRAKMPEVAVTKKPLTLQSPNYSELKTWLASEKGTMAGLLKAYEPDSECMVELRKVKEA